MFELVQKIIAEQMGVKDPESITYETHLVDDLGADSIDAAEIIIAIEGEFDIEIPDDIAESIRKVSELMEFLENAIE
ncbi:MAG: acyl carrier protein [delta proteobacterium ML8_F1]|nr:MAG: acyl carrier protein [delta proteobacterium ML8_F1]